MLDSLHITVLVLLIFGNYMASWSLTIFKVGIDSIHTFKTCKFWFNTRTMSLYASKFVPTILSLLARRSEIRWQIWNEFWQSSRVQMRCARITVRSVRSGKQKACAKASSNSWSASVELHASIVTLPQGMCSLWGDNIIEVYLFI